jgi:hypothetical protein
MWGLVCENVWLEKYPEDQAIILTKPFHVQYPTLRGAQAIFRAKHF